MHVQDSVTVLGTAIYENLSNRETVEANVSIVAKRVNNSIESYLKNSS